MRGEVVRPVIVVVTGALARLAESLLPPGDGALRGLEQDLARVATLDQGWRRLCDTAWALGFVELRMVPTPEALSLLAERHAIAPRSWTELDPTGGLLRAQATWAFGLLAAGRPVATVTARRRLGRVDFEPLRFVRAVQGLLDRFVAAPAASAEVPAGDSAHAIPTSSPALS